ncbi:MAG: GNAT family N-acetyltransferase [Alphaproteobacteria bacterium]
MDDLPRIEPLGPGHNRYAFSCGEPALDAYLRRQAAQDMRRRIAQTFVAIGTAPSAIAGYYSLSAASFARDALPADRAKRLPHYPVPAAILGRLAVDNAWQGRGLGEHLLMDAIHRTLAASRAVAMHALVVDAKNDRVARFYRRYGFLPFPDSPARLFLPLATVDLAIR